MMKMNSTYGYILIQKGIYNVEAFYTNHKNEIDNIMKLT